MWRRSDINPRKFLGIDEEMLSRTETIRHQPSFFNVAQCEIDAFYHSYQREEKLILSSYTTIRDLVNKNTKGRIEKMTGDDRHLLLLNEEQLRKKINNLLDCIVKAKESYIRILKKFDAYHNTAVEEEEMLLFKQTCPFLSGWKLKKLLNHLDELDLQNALKQRNVTNKIQNSVRSLSKYMDENQSIPNGDNSRHSRHQQQVEGKRRSLIGTLKNSFSCSNKNNSSSGGTSLRT